MSPLVGLVQQSDEHAQGPMAARSAMRAPLPLALVLLLAPWAGCFGGVETATASADEGPPPDSASPEQSTQPSAAPASSPKPPGAPPPGPTPEPERNVTETVNQNTTYHIGVGVQGALPPLDGGPTVRLAHSGMPKFSVPREASRIVLEVTWEGNPTMSHLVVHLDEDATGATVLEATGPSPLVLESPAGSRFAAGGFTVQFSTATPAVFVQQDIFIAFTATLPGDEAAIAIA